MDGHGRRVWFDYGRDGVGAAGGSVGWRVGRRWAAVAGWRVGIAEEGRGGGEVAVPC